MKIDLKHVRRRTVAERDYWLDQLVAEVERLQGRIDRALEYIKDSGDDPACNIERILKGEQ